MADEDLYRIRPYCDWHEDLGDVMWWRIPICEAPYVGRPTDLGQTVEVEILMASADGHRENGKMRMDVGGWPYYAPDEQNLWWTPLPDAKRIEDQVPL